MFIYVYHYSVQKVEVLRDKEGEYLEVDLHLQFLVRFLVRSFDDDQYKRVNEL